MRMKKNVIQKSERKIWKKETDAEIRNRIMFHPLIIATMFISVCWNWAWSLLDDSTYLLRISWFLFVPTLIATHCLCILLAIIISLFFFGILRTFFNLSSRSLSYRSMYAIILIFFSFNSQIAPCIYIYERMCVQHTCELFGFQFSFTLTFKKRSFKT